MYDYRMVFVYPLSMPVEDLSELEESALSHLEKSISNTIDDGWEYVSTTTYSNKERTEAPLGERGVKAFVYRRFRKNNVELNGSSAAAALCQAPQANTLARVPQAKISVKENSVAKNEEDPALKRPKTTKDEKKTTLLTMALLNALQAHSDIRPETVLPELRKQGEISDRQMRVLTRNLRGKRSAATIAGITPPGLETDVFKVSLMPFGDQDETYMDYIMELAAYLDLDETFVERELSSRYI